MTRKLSIRPTALAGVHVVTAQRHVDERGAFSRLFCVEELAPVLGSRSIAQCNHSVTREVGTVRGLHFQRPPHGEMKFVRCLRGRVLDIVVDVRAGSPSFLQFHAEELSGENWTMLVAPEGVAHGFQVLEADSEMLYLHTAAYAPQAEDGLNCQDPRLALPWPLPVRGLSARDAALPLLDASFQGVVA